MEEIFTMQNIKDWGGWLFGLISMLTALLQYFQKEKYKKLYQKTQIGNRYEVYNAKDKGISLRNNSGDININ